MYDFKCAIFSGISEFLNLIDWNSELDHSSSDVCESKFYDKLNAPIEKNVPKMKLTATHLPTLT